jgi:hypothetical protein
VKISPAPWHHGYPGGIFAASGQPIAMVYDEPGIPARDANALLMANAPVMLKLLKALAPYAPESARPKLDMFLKKFG